MATKKSTKKVTTPPELKDEDNPSLIKVGGKLCLRVFEDFFVEKELPKWKMFEELKKKLLKELDFFDARSVERYIAEKRRTDAALAADIEKQIKTIREMEDVLKDDKWGIQGKHEKEFSDSLSKMSVFYSFTPTTLRGKFAKWLDSLRKKPALVPVEIAFKDLKDHMEMSTSADVTQAKMVLEGLVKRLETSGQYEKAKSARSLIPQLAHELAIADLGFTKYVSEQQMIDFIKKSERGVTVNFLRYYEGNIPDDIVAKKNEVDSKMIFDNYVIAYYGDFVEEAKKIQEKKKEAKKKSATVSRRDPILFGMIKQTRKLYYICDWVTPEDDLTLSKLEKVLGGSANMLFKLNGSSSDNETALSVAGTNESVVLNSLGNNETIYSKYPTYNYTDNTVNSTNYRLGDTLYRIADEIIDREDRARRR